MKNSIFKESIATEYQEQVALVEYLEIKGLKFSKLAQETFTRSWQVKMKNKMSGVRPGVPDMMIVIPERNAKEFMGIKMSPGAAVIPSRLLFIEMKRSKGGTVSEEQKKWLTELNKCLGVVAVVCKGFDEAKKVIENLLNQ